MIRLTVPDIGEEELEEIRKVFDSKNLVQGDKVEEFENEVKKYLNVKNAIAVSSGTAALHLSLLALGIGNNDEVIIPDFTFPATANVVENVGATTKLVDIKLDNLCINVEKIEELITTNTKVIMPVHEFGQCADMDKVMEIAKKYNLKIIEDAACSLGAEYKGKKAGTIGDLGCFSFHPRKAITTGEGGVIVTNNDELAEKIKILRNHGLSIINGKPQFIMAGLNYRMTNIQGAIGVVQMKKLKNIIKKRIEISHQYNKELRDIKGITLPEEKSYGKHVWQTYHIILSEEINRDELIENLKENGIETNFGAYAVHTQPYYQNKYKHTSSEYINSNSAYKQGLALPLYNEMNYETVIQVKNKIKAVINELNFR